MPARGSTNVKRRRLSLGVVTVLVIAIVAALASAGVFAAEPPRLRLEGEADDRPVVFVPGLTSTPDVFGEAATGHLKAYLAGFAGEPPAAPASPYVVPAAEALAREIEARDLRGVVLVGHSLGGVVSLLAAAEAGDRVTDVLVVDSVPFFPGLIMPGATPEAMAAQAPMWRARTAAMDEATWLATVRTGLDRQATSQADRDRIYADAERSDLASAKAGYLDLMLTDYRPALAGLAARVTILVPHHDAMGLDADTLLATYRAQYAGVPNVRLVLVRDSRHFVMLDQLDAFADALAEVLAGG